MTGQTAREIEQDLTMVRYAATWTVGGKGVEKGGAGLAAPAGPMGEAGGYGDDAGCGGEVKGRGSGERSGCSG